MSLPPVIGSTLKVKLPPSSAQKRKKCIDFTLCILCQERKKSVLVNPKCYEKVLECIKKRAQWNDSEYVNIANVLGDISSEELKNKKASWHSECYKKCTHKANVDRSERRYDEEVHSQKHFTSCHEGEDIEERYTTRSVVPIYDKKKCLFCNEEGSKRNKLHMVATDSAGIRLKSAVLQSGSDVLKIRISDCTSPGDAHAKDILYHKLCWNKHVVNVLRPKRLSTENKCNSHAYQATNAEFLSSLSDYLLEGNVTTMSEIELFYRNIAKGNGLEEEHTKSRKQIKSFIEEELECIGIQFSNPKRLHEAQRVSLKVTADVALSNAEEYFEDVENDMKTLLEAARILRKAALHNENWKFTGSLEGVNVGEVVPKKIGLFFKWCCQGRKHINGHSGNHDTAVTSRALKLSQMLMYEILSPRQASNTTSNNIRHTRELPLQVAVGLTMHAATRSKFIIKFLHSIGASIEYAKILRLETQIAMEVVKRMDECGGFYIPSELVQGRFVYCAADNIDFLEDTSHGKGTLHGTVMVVYQKKEKSDEQTQIKISGSSSLRSLSKIPQTLTEVIPHNIQKGCRPSNPIINQTTDCTMRNKCIIASSMNKDLLWLIAQVMTLSEYQEYLGEELLEGNVNQSEENNPSEFETNLAMHNAVPTWSAFNSILSKPQDVNRVCVLPLLHTSPTTTQTQLTFMKTLEQVTSVITPGGKTVVTLDLGLYKPVLKLAMADKDLSKNWILRPGELHIIMAMLRAIGCYIDGTGLEATLSAVYDESVVANILAGKCVRRAIDAHTSLRLALFKCVSDEFYKEQGDIKEKLEPDMRKLLALLEGESHKIESICDDILIILEDLDVLAKLKAFEVKESQEKPTLKIALQYTEMVDTMLLFIRSVRTADWELHLATLEEFVKYFFALGLINYASMIAWYLADIKLLETKHPDLWTEFYSGNWVVNKTTVPFCSLGTDEALEHENKKMKVLGGVVNITQRKQALTRFFLTSPELSRLSTEAKDMLGITNRKRSKHHHLTASQEKRQKEDAQQMYNYIMASTNPVTYDGQELINISTKLVFDENIQKDMSTMVEKGQELYCVFKEERIQSEKCNFWAPMKKEKLKLCKHANKVVKTKLSDTVITLKADRSLFTRLLIISRSRIDINLQDCISKYEFSAVPRSLFNLDGTMLFSSNKSNLMKLIEEQQHLYTLNVTHFPLGTSDRSPHIEQIKPTSNSYSVAVLDGMAELQVLHKPAHVKTCNDLANVFNRKIEFYLLKYDETHLVFDTYLECSLKNSMRRKRAGKAMPVEYKITDSTNIQKVTMRSLLSHDKNKDELTAYLAKKTILHAQKIKQKLIVSWRNEARSSDENDVKELQSTQEEADTKIILHSLYASHYCTTLHIYSPDTDVFILSLWWSQLLAKDSMFVTGVGANIRSIDINRVYSIMGPTKIKALLALHALSGCDITGSFKNKGKLSFWKAFQTAGEEVLDSLASLGSQKDFKPKDEQLVEQFICQVYLPGKSISDIGELRWWMFTKKAVQSENLPPTRSSLTPYILRVHYQVLEWRSADKQHPNLPEPSQFGWEKSGNQYFPTMSSTLCAPECLLNLVRCGCEKGRCVVSCKCKGQSLRCTEMCKCGGDEELCDNNDFEAIEKEPLDSEDDL